MHRIDTVRNTINDLYHDIEGYKLYTKAKINHGEKYKDLIYSELPIEILDDILTKFECKTGVFYDLGSGIGKIVIAAHMLGNFSKCIGIEILKELHDTADEIGESYKKSLNDTERKEIEFIHGDFLEQDFCDADVILLGLVSQNPDLMEHLEDKINKLKSGTKIITIIGFLKRADVVEVKSKKYNFPWGKSTVYFYEKK